MTEISGKMYLIIGLCVAVFSLVILITAKDRGFIIFAVLGALMFVWGLIKMLKGRKDKASKNETHPHMRMQAQHHQQYRPASHQQGSQHHARGQPANTTTFNNPHPDRNCPKCMNRLKSFDNFCSNCGFRMRP